MRLRVPDGFTFVHRGSLMAGYSANEGRTAEALKRKAKGMWPIGLSAGGLPLGRKRSPARCTGGPVAGVGFILRL
jgi:hypothetical protein